MYDIESVSNFYQINKIVDITLSYLYKSLAHSISSDPQ